MTFAAQDVEHGEVLTLTAGVDQPQPKVYDDLVEAVGDAVSGRSAAWTARDSAGTAIGACIALMLAGGLTLLLDPKPSQLGFAIAAVAMVLIISAAAVTSRLGHTAAGAAFALTGSVFGALAAYLAAAVWAPQWGAAAAAAGLAVAGAIGFCVLPKLRELMLAPVVAGVLLGVACGLTSFGSVHDKPVIVFGILAAVAGVLGNALPWFALTSSRLKAVAPLSDAEIFADPEPVDAESVGRDYAQGQRLLLGLRVAFALCLLVSAWVVAPSGPAGFALAALAFVGMMLGSRQTYSRADVGVVLVTAIAGVTLTAYRAAAANPGWRVAIVLGLSIGVGAVAALTVLGGRPGARLARLADALDMASLVCLLPLGVIVARFAS
jgi:hypothetical protein